MGDDERAVSSKKSLNYSKPIKGLDESTDISETNLQVEYSVNLKPQITLLNGITVIVGCIIGSGIFISPRGVLLHSGSVGMSILVWLGCGLHSMIGAYCYAELGTSIIRSGADYAYIFEAFGPFMAFIRLWVECIIVRPCLTAIVALTFGKYIIEPLYVDCQQPVLAVTFLAALCIGGFVKYLLVVWLVLILIIPPSPYLAFHISLSYIFYLYHTLVLLA